MAKLEKCATLQDLMCYFQEKITATEHCIHLQGNGKDPNRLNIINGLYSNISELQAIISSIRSDIDKRKRTLATVEELRCLIASLQERVNFAHANLPSRLPSLSHKTSERVESTCPAEKRDPSETSKQKQNTKNQQKTVKGKARFQTVSYLTVQEYDSVPKYIKGRLTYERMNTAIDDINKTVEGKYTLIATKKSAHTDYIRCKIISYKEEETKETIGTSFFTDRDVKEFGNSKVDGTFRTIMTILRHCKRIKEARGGGLTRYVVCP